MRPATDPSAQPGLPGQTDPNTFEQTALTHKWLGTCRVSHLHHLPRGGCAPPGRGNVRPPMRVEQSIFSASGAAPLGPKDLRGAGARDVRSRGSRRGPGCCPLRGIAARDTNFDSETGHGLARPAPDGIRKGGCDRTRPRGDERPGSARDRRGHGDGGALGGRRDQRSLDRAVVDDEGGAPASLDPHRDVVGRAAEPPDGVEPVPARRQAGVDPQPVVLGPDRRGSTA